MKKQKESAFIKGMFSSLIILLLLAVLTVFPNLWDNYAHAVSQVIFKTIPFVIIFSSLVVIFCLYEGIGFLFYSERKGWKVGLLSALRFFIPKRFIYLLKFLFKLYMVRLVFFIMIFMPTALVLLCAYIFYKNGCPAVSVGIMYLCTAVLLLISCKFYGEINSLLFLTKYCFFENEKGKVQDLIKESYGKMKGRGGKIKSLRQSFFLPFLSCAFLIPIPFVLTNYKYALSKKAYELMK